MGWPYRDCHKLYWNAIGVADDGRERGSEKVTTATVRVLRENRALEFQAAHRVDVDGAPKGIALNPTVP
jgi:endonuclease V-like protein UPF0215 family